MTVGERIRNRRKTMDMTAEALAEIVGISAATIYRYENGDIRDPGVNKLKPIADALGVTTGYLMGWLTFGEILDDLMTIRGDTFASLGELLCIPAEDVDRMTSGDLDPTPAQLQALSDHYRIPVAQLTGDEFPSIYDLRGLSADAPRVASAPPVIPGMQTMAYTTPRSMVPVIGSVRCGENGLALQEPDGFVPADVSSPDGYFWLRCVGDSMEPRICDGDLVLVRRQPDVDSGDLAVVVVDGEEGTLKKVIKKGDMVILEPYNHAHPTRYFVGADCAQLLIAGKVIELKRKF